MTFTTLISPTELSFHLKDRDWIILDCRFSLADSGRGRRDYLQAHIPGGVYAHLDEDLSGPVMPGVTGRHPLPAVEKAAETFARWGIGPETQVVAYDDAGGALAAARAWWLLRWLGHEVVAVLDGGWQGWQSPGYAVTNEIETRSTRGFIPRPNNEMLVNTPQVEAMLHNTSYRIIDARTAERYRGENETIDPVAGHIPGAVNAPYVDNLTSEGTFRPVEELRQRYRILLQDIPSQNAIFYCGSGVTSIHDILAMRYAGLGEARLYAGSWSEWITDPNRPVAK